MKINVDGGKKINIQKDFYIRKNKFSIFLNTHKHEKRR